MTGSGATPSGQETNWALRQARKDLDGLARSLTGAHQEQARDIGDLLAVADWHALTEPPPAPVQEAPIDSSLIAAHPVAADQTPVQEAGSGRHVQSAARNLTSGPGMSSELDGGRQAAVEAVARWLVRKTYPKPYGSTAWDLVLDADELTENADEIVNMIVAALTQPEEPT